MDVEEPRVRISTMHCVPCLQAGKECFYSVQQWGGGDLKFDCNCCGHGFIIEKKDQKVHDDSPAGIEGSKG